MAGNGWQFSVTVPSWTQATLEGDENIVVSARLPKKRCLGNALRMLSGCPRTQSKMSSRSSTGQRLRYFLLRLMLPREPEAFSDVSTTLQNCMPRSASATLSRHSCTLQKLAKLINCSSCKQSSCKNATYPKLFISAFVSASYS